MTWDEWILDGNFKGKVIGAVSRFSTEKSLKIWDGTGFPKEKCK